MSNVVCSNMPALRYKIVAECGITKARVGIIHLKHSQVETPVFMPVGTQGTMKGILADQLVHMNCQIILANTYHLGSRPGPHILKKAGGLHEFMSWPRAMLTDSGGFQIVSLSKLADITEEGVNFVSPYDGSQCMLTPEHSIQIQNAIGADIIMQLDDVVKTTTRGPRVEEAMHRTVRWLDRCLNAHERDEDQSIFPIVQGGLDAELRRICVSELTKRKVRGIAIGGLSGGESKEDFWSIVNVCTNLLPKEKPRYLMGVGFATDLIVCIALGIDMFDCVFPTRTARFGCALTDAGQLNLKHKKYALDLRPITEGCNCTTCTTYTRSYLHHIVSAEPVSSSLLTIHNIYYQMRLMENVRESIKGGCFPDFINDFLSKQFPEDNIPKWINDALGAVGVHLSCNKMSNKDLSK